MQDDSNGISWNPVERHNGRKLDMPLDNFFKQARNHLREIKKARESLQEAQINFNGIEDIWQCHLDFTLTALECLAEPLRAFYSLAIGRYEDFPAVICQHWCKLVLKLNHIEEQSHMLKTLLNSPCPPRQSFSWHMLSQRKEIYFRIKALLTSSNDFCQETTHLLEDAQLLSRQDNKFYPLDPKKDFLYEGYNIPSQFSDALGAHSTIAWQNLN